MIFRKICRVNRFREWENPQNRLDQKFSIARAELPTANICPNLTIKSFHFSFLEFKYVSILNNFTIILLKSNPRGSI